MDAWAERDAVHDSRRIGRDLAYALKGGAEPLSISTRMVLELGEFCVGETDVLVLEWLPAFQKPAYNRVVVSPAPQHDVPQIGTGH